MLEKLKNITFSTSNYFSNSRVAVGINLFNRIEGIEEYIERINACEELQDIPIFIFIDGGRNSKQPELIEKCKTIKHKNKFLIKRNENYGCERSFIDIFNTILCDLNFEYLFFIEDDIIVSKNYFKYLFDTFNNIKKTDQNIGIFQGYNFCVMSKEEKLNNIDKVTVAEIEENIGLWGFIMSQDAWKDMRQVLEEYENIINSLPYNGNSHLSMVTTHRQRLIQAYNNIVEKYELQDNPVVIEKFYKKENKHCTISIDGAMALALIASDRKRYKPIVNRCLNVGETGAHFTKEIYKKIGLDRMTLDEFL